MVDRAVVLFIGEAWHGEATQVEIPLALERLDGVRVLDHWWASLGALRSTEGLTAQAPAPTDTFIVTSARHYKPFERWVLSKGLDVDRVINTGDTLSPVVTLGQLCDAVYAMEKLLARDGPSPTTVYLVAADSSPSSGDATGGLAALARATPGAATLAVPIAGPVPTAPIGPVAVLDVAPDGRVRGVTSSSSDSTAAPADPWHAAPLLAKLDAAALRALSDTGRTLSESARGAPAIDWIRLVAASDAAVLRAVVEAPPAPGTRLGLPSGATRHAGFGRPECALPASGSEDSIHCFANARVGLMGNPSDGFFGRTVSVTIANFWAEAWVWPDDSAAGRSGRVTLVANPVYDPESFDNIEVLAASARREGYSGGRRLLHALLYRLHDRLRSAGVAPHPERVGRGFILRWHTNIPRQVGLAGSSAILTAVLRAMLRWYRLDEDPAALERARLTDNLVPSFVLSIEMDELGIQAGLQDRVSQWWGGIVAMDFAKDKVEARGHGDYSRLDARRLPRLFLAYAPDPSDSGKIHMPVRQRWQEGDPIVVEGMKTIAGCAADAQALLASAPGSRFDEASTLAALMTRNFDTRRIIFTDAALGRANIHMIEIARSVGASAKFPGSGGAVLGCVDPLGMLRSGSLAAEVVDTTAAPGTAEHEEAFQRACDHGLGVLRRAYADNGYVCVELHPCDVSGRRLPRA